MSDNQFPVDDALDQLVADLPQSVAEALGRKIAARAEKEAEAIRDAELGAEFLARNKRIEAIRVRLAELRGKPSYQAAVSSEIGRLTMELSQLQKEGWGQ